MSRTRRPASGEPVTPWRHFPSEVSTQPVRCVVVWIVWLVVVISLVVPVFATASGEGVDREAELEAIRDQIMVLQGRLNRVRQEATGLRGELAQTEVALQLRQKRLEEASTARQLAEASLTEVEAEIVDLEARLAELRHRLRRRLLDLYRLGRHGYMRLFLSIDSRDDLLPGIRQVRFLARRDAVLLESYLQAQTELEFKQQELASHREAAERWLQEETGRTLALQRVQERQAGLLQRLEQEDLALSRQASTLVDKERKLANLLDFLYGRTATPLSGTPVQNFRGVLDWPVSGRVVRGFGTRLDPRYGTRVPHNGIELVTPPATDVRAVYPGKVLFAAPFQGYGLTVVVHHPGRVFSLYAGLSELRVRRDDMLSLGKVIGLSGTRIYFEIREENRPVNPSSWLR